MIGRIILRPVVAAAALYVLLAMAVALVRIPGHDVRGDARYAREAPAAQDSELYELRTEDIVP